MNIAAWFGLLSIALLMATPVLLAMLGEMLTQRTGIVNLGVEGQMLVGAAAGFAVTYASGSPWLGMLVGALAGMALSSVHALLCLGLGVNQIASGLAIFFLGNGLSAFYGAPLVGQQISGFHSLAHGWLGHLPIVGSFLGQLTPTVYLALILVLLCGLFLYRTQWGLVWRATGESADALRMLGKKPVALRIAGILTGGLFTGLAGAALSVDYTRTWVEQMTAGRGLLAVGLVIVARWNPWLALPVALIYGLSEALALRLQSMGADISPYLLGTLPYLVPLVVLLLSYRASQRGTSMPQELVGVFRGMA
ncbi:putative glucose ABC transporter permease protein TsgC13 [Thiomonas arsenitoxydans]|jgi:simple sugar transport system permease protein|uniref:ABC-type transport system, permease component n=1 Tax=Thiomonas arsenitoxydans (strain DSM 22701 / CIP 110005 / 3As) TaxID=426114 RepID=D6CNU0_THIA3|nr:MULTISPECIES: ABC transporter permease [Thiomonas]OZB77400.1 MAG: ABC transporter permease [Thiomonas sp. 14-64-326]CAZ90218.1 putative ABC-type transport system, permease component [Thiomonas arsenitoxydans]CQR31064.1 putative glucose ABC transporter permease protein TsgC13 [Thiomonas arsenitoxydans]CQR36629.1 putative glucose ABC transporter permease protein TsgC13 [Thiomonas arsenitoxydans]CQR40799.1 putative glucose ABC transporter permease protein TsgC13 [Thiomonas arsenitoxydans]